MEKIPWKIQKTNFTCGNAAFRNCLLTFGMNVSEERLRELMKTTKDGTDADNICEAAKKLDLNYKLVSSSSKDVFGRKLLKALKQDRPCILLVEDTSHWVAAVSYKKRKIKIIDSELIFAQNTIEKDFYLKEVLSWSMNFNKFTKETYFLLIEIWPKN